MARDTFRRSSSGRRRTRCSCGSCGSGSCGSCLHLATMCSTITAAAEAGTSPKEKGEERRGAAWRGLPLGLLGSAEVIKAIWLIGQSQFSPFCAALRTTVSRKPLDPRVQHVRARPPVPPAHQETRRRAQPLPRPASPRGALLVPCRGHTSCSYVYGDRPPGQRAWRSAHPLSHPKDHPGTHRGRGAQEGGRYSSVSPPAGRHPVRHLHRLSTLADPPRHERHTAGGAGGARRGRKQRQDAGGRQVRNGVRASTP
ncbi:hypothetical protein FOCC_FOCC013199 [Frankliniella occidentalis]|nr:hypothetical protein FOCC_FOCC013199 [Frankliniella occidentalis]